MARAASKATVGEEPEGGVLYVVPTPLGHRGDLSPRAAHILGTVELLLCEDTRVTRKLLAELDARPELHACHDHNERQRVGEVVAWLEAGRTVALVSDAGTPLVSDPGYAVVQGVLAADHRVIALPGPVAATTALSASGLAPDRFTFAGFPPRKPKERTAWLEALADRPDTLLFYCSCHRISDDLAAMRAVFADRAACASRDLTKRGELHLRGTLSEVLAELAGWDRITGEWTVCVAGAEAVAAADGLSPETTALIEGMVTAGMSPRAVRDLVVAATGASKKEVYAAALAAGQR